MKRITVLILLLLKSSLYASDDYVSLCAQGLSIHPGNQDNLARYYPRKLNRDAWFILTPGVLCTYDKSVQDDLFTHYRLACSYFDDCASMPAGYLAAGGLIDFLDKKYLSVQCFIGIAGYVRKNWKYKIEHHSSAMFAAGPVEWIVLPFPGVEIQLHPADDSVQLIANFACLIYVSMVDVGFRVRL